MVFNSLEFIFLFLPLTLCLYFVISKARYYQLASLLLLFASLLFYAWSYPPYLLLLIASVVFNYLIGSFFKANFANLFRKKLWLTIGVATNLIFLGYFKYTNFFLNTLNPIFHTSFSLSKIFLPLGISFFTFQQIAYLVDTYKGETKESGFLNYCLFATFFPQLISGPISRHYEISPQFSQRLFKGLNSEDIAIGITIFLIGLFKKVVIADSISAYVDPVFHAASQGIPLTFSDAWTGALAYTFQLYFDFSGYSEMALGVARMFSIKLPLNFNSPYKAINIIDFWRRWHISLSNFLRDYLYISFGGSRQGQVRRYINLMMTMLLGGLWHGAGWTFVIWGGLHGLYLCLNHFWHSCLQKLGQDSKKIPWWGKILGVLITFLAVVISWVIFRANNVNSALIILKSMSGLKEISLALSIVESPKKLLVFLLLFVWLFPNTSEWLIHYNPALIHPKIESELKQTNFLGSKFKWKPNQTTGIIIGIITFICLKILTDAPASQFLYAQF